jgi:predicted transcriptional regulator
MSGIGAQARPELVERIGELARDTGSTSDELARAVEAYRDLERWQLTAIDEAIAEDDRGDPGVPNEEVMRWLESWGTENELPPPTPPKR